MPSIPAPIPSVIPFPPPAQAQPALPGTPNSLYDFAINDIGFLYASSADNPMMRETVPLERTRIDQAKTPGEQTLTGWWITSQDSFHGGAGQLNLEQSQGDTPVTHIRYDVSKNCNVFMPGQVTRLPDTTRLTTDHAVDMVALSVAGADAVAYLVGSSVKLITSVTGTPATATFAAAGTTVLTIATDGQFVYGASLSTVYKWDPANPATAPVVVATFTAAVNAVNLGWVKSRLVLGADNSIYEIDITTTGTVLTPSNNAIYTNPTPGFVWRAFANSPSSVQCAGDAGGVSVITSLTVQNVSGVPTLQAQGDVATMPQGERILSLLDAEGSFLAIGTTSGVRIGTYDAYYGRLTYGPLILPETAPTLPCNALVTRGHFVYAACKDYDEAGLVCVDLGTQTDQAGRLAWAPNLITNSLQTARVAVVATVLPQSNRIVFGCDGTLGVWLEGATPGTGREAWLRTSRMRFDTAEPKLFKLGSIRGDLSNGSVNVQAVTPNVTVNLVTQGFLATDPPEFSLPSEPTEWLQTTFTLTGAPTLRTYSVKALPGTRRQLYINMVAGVFDNESTKTGQRIREPLSTRDRLNSLEALVAAGDEVLLQEYTPSGVVSTVVVIEKSSFKQDLRPTRRSDFGGELNILMRTVDQ